MKTINFNGKIWTLRSDLEKITHWTADWYCSDGDGIELYIEKDKSGFELSCFSGIPASKIWIDSIDFHPIWRKVCEDKNYDIGFSIVEKPLQIPPVIDDSKFFKKTFEEQSVILADWFCSKFCEFHNSSSYIMPPVGTFISKKDETN